MKNLLIGLVLVSMAVFAAKFKSIETQDLTNKVLKNLVSEWKSVANSVDGTDTEAFSILSKDSSEALENTLKQIYHSKRANEVEVTKMSATKASVDKVLEALNDASMEKLFKETSASSISSLKREILKVVENEEVRIFRADVSYSDECGYRYLVIFDKENDELLAIGAGFCE